MGLLMLWSIAAFATVLCQTPTNFTPSAELINNIFDVNFNNSVSPNNSMTSETGCLDGQICVKWSLCRNTTINKYGAKIIRIRFDDDNPNPCPHYLEQCCNISDTTVQPTVSQRATREGCGFRNRNGLLFQITGNNESEAEFGEFPWMVAILTEQTLQNRTANQYLCGGSLIHPKVVLTGGHCIADKNVTDLKIRVGEWDTQTQAEYLLYQERYITKVAIHEEYGVETLLNDIALMFLESPVELAPHIQTICLPPANAAFDFARCIATGWGKNKYSQDGVYQAIMKKIELPIVPRDVCQKQLRATVLSKYFELHSSFICAGGEEGKGTCTGDGGSPLVCPIAGTEDQYVQAGIVAWGIAGCAEKDVPEVYADVAGLRSWLDEKLALEKIESSYYSP